MTMRTPNVDIRPSDTLDISQLDAEALEMKEGQSVRIRSRYGEAVLPIRISDTVRPGELFASFHVPGIFLNRVTSKFRDRYVHAPEYKVTAVRIEPAEHAAQEPVT
jgi:formate dehydrogenase major subunit